MIQPVIATNSLSFSGGLKFNKKVAKEPQIIQPLKEKTSQVLNKEKFEQSWQKGSELSKKIKAFLKKHVIGDEAQVKTKEELEQEAIATRKAEIIFFLILLASQVAFMLGPWVALYIKIRSLLK